MKYTFYWKNGDRSVLKGKTPEAALNLAGFGGGAIAALDFWAKGDDQKWEWRDKRWQPK